MKCGEAKELFSPYLDGALTGRQMQTLTWPCRALPEVRKRVSAASSNTSNCWRGSAAIGLLLTWR